MKITKWEVHVHASDNPDVEVASKIFLCGNDDKGTVIRAITTGDDETFKRFVNDEKYIIHVVDGTCMPEEEKIFMEMAKNDTDPDNFYITKDK
ncbi:hypothetical protein FWH09_00715 [Candidatus Saccharibacteria bacterium]|nr:hypothetical protein [Candidatus Saccharibacteria bacterium]